MNVITSNNLNILSFGYGRNFFDRENKELRRMQSCSEAISSLHMVIFTLRSDKLQTYQIGNLTLYPTNSRTRLHYCFDAFRIGLKILRDTSKKWVITTQDPFETGCIGLLLSWWSKIPCNVQEHGDFYSRPYWRHDKWGNRIRFVIGLMILKRADTVRVVSNRIAEALQKRGIKSDKILHLPVRTDTLDEVKNTGPDLKQLYPEASVIILTMARLVPQKNLLLLIDAFSELMQAEPKAQLVIIGDGPLASVLKKEVSTRGLVNHVSFIPWTDTPQSYMRSADIYALSSDWEGWARVLIEAMEAGVPVVTTDVGCAGEAIRHRQHGLVVPVRDVGSFATALKELVCNPTLRAEYGINAKRDVCKWHVSPEMYAKLSANVFLTTEQKRKQL